MTSTKSQTNSNEESPKFPSPPPSPHWREGKGEGRSFGVGAWSLFGIWDLEFEILLAKRKGGQR
jgi:hypothetical protein